MDNLKTIVIVVVCVAVLTAGAFGVRYLLSVQQYKKMVEAIKIKDVDLSAINDGSYTGSFDAAGIVRSKVNVIVANHKIVDIKLTEHKNERGAAANDIPLRVVKAQSLKVDTVSGATNSSKVILKSIENALNGVSDEQ